MLISFDETKLHFSHAATLNENTTRLTNFILGIVIYQLRSTVHSSSISHIVLYLNLILTTLNR